MDGHIGNQAHSMLTRSLRLAVKLSLQMGGGIDIKIGGIASNGAGDSSPETLVHQPNAQMTWLPASRCLSDIVRVYFLLREVGALYLYLHATQFPCSRDAHYNPTD